MITSFPSFAGLCRAALLVLVALGGASLGGCGDLMTDAATRLANDIVREARELKKSGSAERTFVHHTKASPEGCPGPFGVRFQESLHWPDKGGALLIRCGDAASGRDASFSTTYHLNAVRVPVELSVEKAQGADLRLTLRKNGDAIELVALE